MACVCAQAPEEHTTSPQIVLVPVTPATAEDVVFVVTPEAMVSTETEVVAPNDVMDTPPGPAAGVNTPAANAGHVARSTPRTTIGLSKILTISVPYLPGS